MLYFKEKDNKILRYVVSVDVEKLKSIKEEVINNCSDLVHRECESITPSVIRNSSKYRNVESRFIGTKKLYGSANHANYWMEYDELIYPDLVTLIDALLNNDESAISKLEEYNPSINIDSIKEEINSLSAQIPNTDMKSIADKLGNIKNSAEEIAIKNTKLKEYAKKVLETCEFKLDTFIYKTSAKEVCAFFNDSESYVTENTKKLAYFSKEQ